MAWQDKPLFYNRPVYVNTPIKVRYGLGGTWGTYFCPLGHYYLQSQTVSDDNVDINIRGVDGWGKYGDLRAGTLIGLQDISNVVRHICDYNGITKDKQYIDNVKRDYTGAALYNTKEPPLAWGNTGFGDIWEFRNIKSSAGLDGLYFLNRIGQDGITGYSVGMFVQGYGNNENIISENSNWRWDRAPNNKSQHTKFHGYLNDYLTNSNYKMSWNSPGAGAKRDGIISNLNAIYRHNGLPTVIPSNFDIGAESESAWKGQKICSYYNTNNKRLYGIRYGVIGGKVFYNMDKFVQTGFLSTQYFFPMDGALGWIVTSLDTTKPTLGASLDIFCGAGTTQGYNPNTKHYAMMYNSAEGTGYMSKFENNISKLYTFTLNFSGGGTVKMYGTGTLQAGAGTNIEVTALFQMPRPKDTYQGTNLYYYCGYGNEGTNKYMYRWGTEGGTFGYIDKVLINSEGYIPYAFNNRGTNLNSGGWRIKYNIYHAIGHRYADDYSDTLRQGIFMTGLFGMTFQHDTIDNTPTILKNGVTYETGSYVLNTDKTQIYFNNLHEHHEFWTSNYTIYGMHINVGSLSQVKFKEALVKLQVPGFMYSYFDNEGNFHFHTRSRLTRAFTVGDAVTASYDYDEFNEPIMSGQSEIDVNRVRNVITVKGTNAEVTITDGTSIMLYGTRPMGVYSNSYLPQLADCGTVAKQLIDYFKYPKKTASVNMPIHPEVEVFDMFNYVDSANDETISGLQTKRIEHNLEDFTTKLNAEERGFNKTGEAN